VLARSTDDELSVQAFAQQSRAPALVTVGTATGSRCPALSRRQVRQRRAAHGIDLLPARR